MKGEHWLESSETILNEIRGVKFFGNFFVPITRIQAIVEEQVDIGVLGIITAGDSLIVLASERNVSAARNLFYDPGKLLAILGMNNSPPIGFQHIRWKNVDPAPQVKFTGSDMDIETRTLHPLARTFPK